MTSIILCMIVKNEAAIIRRCLDSVRDFVSGICICDTGSTDATKQIITDFCEEHKLPHLITEEPFQNFGHNRTIVLQEACKFAKHSPSTYLLTIDADMILMNGENLNREELLSKDVWEVEQKHGGHSHWNPRLLRASVPWKSTGVTHEYLEAEPPGLFSLARCFSIFIDDKNDGGSKGDKAERDIRLLQGALEKDPKNPRTHFYLANTLRETRKFEEAIEHYEIHRMLSKWDEEKFYSMYYIGICCEELRMWPEALEAYLQAFQERPTRAEPMYRIARYYRNTNRQTTAFIFAQAAAIIPYPKHDGLFIDRTLYDYRILEELSITAYWAKQMDVGRDALYTLLEKKGLPDVIRHNCTYNLRFYIQPFPGEMKWIKLQPTLPSGYLPCNPSIVFDKETGKSIINVRAVNYTQKVARNYKAPNDLFQTENVMLMEEGRASSQLIQCEWQGKFIQTCKVRGLEDIRLFWFGRQLFATCTSLESRSDHVPQMILCQFSEDFSVINKVIPLTYLPAPNRCQKNWLPFEDAQTGEMLAVYCNTHLEILKIDPITGHCTIQVISPMQREFETRHMKGSAGPVRLPDSTDWLVLVHETVDQPLERRYWQRFIRFSHDWQWKAISDPFYFRHAQGVEFASSMALKGDILHIAMGIEDSEAWMCQVQLADVLRICYNDQERD